MLTSLLHRLTSETYDGEQRFKQISKQFNNLHLWYKLQLFVILKSNVTTTTTSQSRAVDIQRSPLCEYTWSILYSSPRQDWRNLVVFLFTTCHKNVIDKAITFMWKVCTPGFHERCIQYVSSRRGVLNTKAPTGMCRQHG